MAEADKNKKLALNIEMGIVRKKLTKTAVCKRVGMKNSNFSNMLNRGKNGLPMQQETVDAVMKAIDELPGGAR